jgi:hypothetical protein
MCFRRWKNKTTKRKAMARQHFRCLEHATSGQRSCILLLQARYMLHYEGANMILVCFTKSGLFPRSNGLLRSIVVR